jgi:hypothetical protein
MRRLNSKLKIRNVEIADLITDLSDGVRACPSRPREGPPGCGGGLLTAPRSASSTSSKS